MPISALLVPLLLALAPAPQDPRGIPRPRLERPYPLIVGDPAPGLDVGAWLKGNPVERFEPGTVYLVHFWASWAMPAVRNFELLSDLSRRYPESLVVIGVDCWEGKPEEMPEYVRRMGMRLDFRVATDRINAPCPEEYKNRSRWNKEHGMTSDAWITKAGRKEDGLPVAFLVDRQGRVAWIGDPKELERPLAAVIEGTWDLEREAEDYRQRMVRLVETRPILRQLEAAQQRREWETVVGYIGELMALDPEANAHLAGTKFQALLVELGRPEEAYAFGREALTSLARDSLDGLAHIASVVAYRAQPGPEERKFGIAVATRADDLARSENAMVLDVLARLHFLDGDLELAIATEQLALGKARDNAERETFTKRLQQYEEQRPR